MSQGKSDAKYHAKIGSFCKQTGCWVEFFLSLLRDTCFFRIWKSDIFTAIFFFFFLPFQIPKISRTSFLKKDDPSERFFSFTIFHKHFLKMQRFRIEILPPFLLFHYFRNVEIPKISQTSFLKKDLPRNFPERCAFNFLSFLENVTFSNRNFSAIFIIFPRRIQISKMSRIALGKGEKKKKKEKFTIKPRSFAETLMDNARIDHGK